MCVCINADRATFNVVVGMNSLPCVCVQLKEILSSHDKAPVAQQCLIFAGKILKDEETLVSQGIKDGLTVHMVIRSTGSKVGQCRRRLCYYHCCYY